MRHRKAVLKLNRTPSHRKAMFRNLVTSLFKFEKIQTTGAKAKELRRWADHLITLAKRGDLHARRQALAIVREKDVVHKLFEHAAERYGAVSGGYTRVVKLGYRPGDGAPVALVELIYSQEKKKKKTRKKKAKADAASQKTAAASKPSAGEEKPEAEVKTSEASAKKSRAKATDDKPKSAAKTAPKKKTAAGEAKEKSVTKAATEKKATAQSKAAGAGKQDKPEKKARGATSKKDASAAEKKKAPAKKTSKDEK